LLENLVLGALTGAEVHPPLREDDTALVVDAALVEGGGVGPILQDEERAIEGARNVGRHAQCVLRVVVAGRGVGVWPEAQAERGQEREKALPRKMLGALELHVFDEMREALLVVVLEDGSGFDDEAQLSASTGLLVRPHVVSQPIRQLACDRFRIDRHLLR